MSIETLNEAENVCDRLLSVTFYWNITKKDAIEPKMLSNLTF